MNILPKDTIHTTCGFCGEYLSEHDFARNPKIMFSNTSGFNTEGYQARACIRCFNTVGLMLNDPKARRRLNPAPPPKVKRQKHHEEGLGVQMCITAKEPSQNRRRALGDKE